MDPITYLRDQPQWLECDWAQIPARLEMLASEYARPVYDGSPATEQTQTLRERFWQCLLFHGQQFAPNRKIEFQQLIERVQTGPGQPQPIDLLADVALAVALEHWQNRAVVAFQTRFSATIHRAAQHTAGQRGLDLAENFAAVLLLPRERSPARIAGYTGKTPLEFWLRSVVTNYCLSELRRPSERASSDEVQRFPATVAVNDLEGSACAEMVRPLVRQAFSRLPAVDRLLLRWLTLDDLPQQQVATALGIHAGNVTRRRQKAVAAVLHDVEQAAEQQRIHTATRECLDLLLTASSSLAREQFSQWLAADLSSLAPAGEVTR